VLCADERRLRTDPFSRAGRTLTSIRPNSRFRANGWCFARVAACATVIRPIRMQFGKRSRGSVQEGDRVRIAAVLKADEFGGEAYAIPVPASRQTRQPHVTRPVIRQQLKHAVARVGLGTPARSLLDLRDPSRKRERLDNEHLRLLLAFTLHEDSNCVDAGANHGVVLEQIVRYAPNGRHYAFEPIPALAGSLTARFPGVSVRQIALSDRAGTATFSHVLDGDGYSGLSDRDLTAKHMVTHFETPVATLDDILPADYRPHLLKIDVEGAEHALLLGAERILSSYRPLIWLEHGEDASSHFGVTSTDVWDLLCETHGYRIIDADGVGPLSREEFSGCLGRMWNFLAR
jgi:FkbM family methyltransferase